MKITIRPSQHSGLKPMTFECPTQGSGDEQYIWLVDPPITANQLCQGGKHTGQPITANADNFIKKIYNWYKQWRTRN